MKTMSMLAKNDQNQHFLELWKLTKDLHSPDAFILLKKKFSVFLMIPLRTVSLTRKTPIESLERTMGGKRKPQYLLNCVIK